MVESGERIFFENCDGRRMNPLSPAGLVLYVLYRFSAVPAASGCGTPVVLYLYCVDWFDTRPYRGKLPLTKGTGGGNLPQDPRSASEPTGKQPQKCCWQHLAPSATQRTRALRHYQLASSVLLLCCCDPLPHLPHLPLPTPPKPTCWTTPE